MNGTNLFKIALRALANNKLRAFLTMLGIIIGVASVITMLAIGQGSKKSIQAQISEMGSNMIMIHPGADMRGGVRLAAWNGKEYAAVSSPFLLERETGKIRFIVPEAEKQELVLYRKCHLTLSVLFNDRMIGGVVEGSDRADFGWKDTLLLIKEAPYRLYTVARLKSDKPYRYMRYKGADGCFCNISELAFYENTEDTIPLYGEIIGTPGSFEDNTHEYLNAFDGNPDTSFDYIHPDGGWTGMDFGSPHRVEKVVYTPRNEVNFIYKGNLYELFYWGGGKWNSVGRQMAVSDSIVYSGFQGALFYLKNHTAGKDERIFEYKDGKQIFW